MRIPCANAPTRRAFSLAALAVLAGCGGSSKTATTPAATGPCRSVEAPEPREGGDRTPPARPLSADKEYALVVRTNCGTFVVRLDTKRAPRTSASLVKLARSGYFDGTVFHRIVPGFVIQGGDPTQTGSGGPGYKTVDRPPLDAKYTKGVVAMAKTQAEPPGTAGSQFFVVTAPNAALPPEYAVVGRVVKGLGVVDRIGRLGDVNEAPTQTVEIERVVVTVG